MPRKGRDHRGLEGPADPRLDQTLATAYQAIAALPVEERTRLYTLVQQASGIPLTESEVERIAAILWAERGEGVFASLEAGFRLFDPADQPRRRRRPVSALTPSERQQLLAALLAERHVPPERPGDES